MAEAVRTASAHLADKRIRHNEGQAKSRQPGEIYRYLAQYKKREKPTTWH
jgi:hypothetical protein